MVISHKLLNPNPITILYDSLNTVRKYQQDHASNRSPVTRYFRLAGLHYFSKRNCIEDDVTCIDILAGQVPEDSEVPGDSRPG